MTSRLKRKLDNMGVDTSNVTQNFCMIGTPLPSLEKADKNEFVPVWKQDVRDEKGRRRLHGAFTGGFSAGYFNTVGSKEGWTPAAFVSSRSNRAGANRVQRAEDFMDDEDLEEMRADQKLVDTTQMEGMTGLGDGAPSDDNGIWNALVPSVRDSPGGKLLQKMGWRPGQGIGPRITYAKRRAQDKVAGAGAGAGASAADEEMDEEAGKHLYAPRDTALVTYRAKDNSFGLGWVPGAGLREGESAPKRKDESGPVLSAGFGLGALNDADEDDLDVYEGTRHPIDKRGLAIMDVDDEDRVLLDSRHASGSRRPTAGPVQRTQDQDYFPDGRPVLPGFKPAQAPLSEDAWFAPPEVPEGWEPDPTRVWETNGSVKGPVPSAAGQDGKPTALRAEERGAMLGETPLAPRSVFDYLSKEAREKLQKASAALKPPPTPEIKREPSPPPEVKMEIPALEPATASAALRGYQPFTSDPVKHQRYTAYLQMQSTISERPPELSPLPRQSIEAFNKEMEDYAKAARIFKPATGAMASRFTSSSTVEVSAKAKEGLHAPDEGGYLDRPKLEDEVQKLEVLETPKQHAARMGMFGPLTREVSVWAPASLLCKRFGVKDPYPGGMPVDERTSASTSAGLWTSAVDTVPTSQPAASTSQPSKSTEEKENVSATKKDINHVGLGDDDEQGQDILTYEKPGMDVFKAIFASDDEDSDEEDEPAPPPSESKALPAPLKPVENESVAPHLYAESSSAVVYAPGEASGSGSIDLVSFKPTFIRKADRKTDADGDKIAKRDKTDKKRKDKHLLISFDEEEGITVTPSRDDERIKKRKREDKDRSKDRDKGKEREEKRKRKREDEEEDGMWVEKSAPEIVSAPAKTEMPEHDRYPGRKRAADFF